MVPATWGRRDGQPRHAGEPRRGLPRHQPHAQQSHLPHPWDADPPPHVNPPRSSRIRPLGWPCCGPPRPFPATKAPFCRVTSPSRARHSTAAPGAQPPAQDAWLPPTHGLPPQRFNQTQHGGSTGPWGTTEGDKRGDPAPQPYQRVDAGQGVVGVVQGVEQLVDAVVGLAVPVEANADGRAAGREGTPGQRGGTRSPRHVPFARGAREDAGTPAGQGTLPRAFHFRETPPPPPAWQSQSRRDGDSTTMGTGSQPGDTRRCPMGWTRRVCRSSCQTPRDGGRRGRAKQIRRICWKCCRSRLNRLPGSAPGGEAGGGQGAAPRPHRAPWRAHRGHAGAPWHPGCQQAKPGRRSEPAARRHAPARCLRTRCSLLPPIKPTRTGPFATIWPLTAANRLSGAVAAGFEASGELQDGPGSPAGGHPEAGAAGGPGGLPGGHADLVSAVSPLRTTLAGSRLAPPRQTGPFVWRAGRGRAAAGPHVPSRPPPRARPAGGHRGCWQGDLPATGCRNPGRAWEATRALPGEEMSPRLIVLVTIKAGRARDLAGRIVLPPAICSALG